MEGTFLQSIGVFVGVPSHRIYIPFFLATLSTGGNKVIKVGGVDYILVNFTLFVHGTYRDANIPTHPLLTESWGGHGTPYEAAVTVDDRMSLKLLKSYVHTAQIARHIGHLCT